MSAAPKKKFGQNFLTSTDVPRKIVQSSGVGNETNVLEIGPGKGIMTRLLAQVCKKTVCVEIDTDLRQTLENALSDCDNTEIIFGDIMQTDIDTLIDTHFSGERVSVVANLPYYITTPIIMKLLSSCKRIDSVTVMVQKEVAQRICALPDTPEYGAFTVAVSYYCDAHKCFNVPRGCFFPVPNVDSAVVRLDIRKNKKCVPTDEAVFFNTVSHAFGKRRKTLLNALAPLCGDKDNTLAALTRAGISPTLRGETLSTEQFCIIANEITGIINNSLGGTKMTNNAKLNAWISEMAELCQPDNIVFIDGSEEQADKLRAIACSTGEMFKLNQELLPGCYLHRTAINDVARVENRTFICTSKKEDAGPNNNWMAPQECYDKLSKLYKNSMRGKTMYVIPYSMGVVGSEFAKNGIELTDSIYVVLNMLIMTRAGKEVLDSIGTDGDFVKGLHSRADMDENERYICHFPEDNTIWSVNSGYGGNVLLGKKCFALRIASYLGKNEGWMAEHMLILGIESPDGEINYISAAFPSACGKTNLAMLIPPEIYRNKGYKVWTVGDDIAWIRIGEDGRLWAANPENGFFGVAPGTNVKSNPNALETTKRDTIFTNVVHNLDNDTVWWEGLDKNPPKNALNWKGEKWDSTLGEKGAHPNSRFTSKAINCPCISSEFNNPKGVPLTAIVFGGRRAKTAPLVYQSRDWDNGVFVGSIMASETTAAAAGKVGVVRRDPMAMLPFVGYNMGDYFAHWLEMGTKVKNAPKIFNVNWFRLTDDGKFIWPGYGENFRILEWILKRCKGEVGAREAEIGFLPYPEDINLEGLEYNIDENRPFNVNELSQILNVEKDYWLEDTKSIAEFYARFGDRMPKKLLEELDTLIANLSK